MENIATKGMVIPADDHSGAYISVNQRFSGIKTCKATATISTRGLITVPAFFAIKYPARARAPGARRELEVLLIPMDTQVACGNTEAGAIP